MQRSPTIKGKQRGEWSQKAKVKGPHPEHQHQHSQPPLESSYSSHQDTLESGAPTRVAEDSEETAWVHLARWQGLFVSQYRYGYI